MKTIITTPDPEPFPIAQDSIHNSYSGLLNSNYKRLVNRNFKSLKKPSVFNIKRRLKSNQFNACCNVETILKLSLFFIVFLITIN